VVSQENPRRCSADTREAAQPSATRELVQHRRQSSSPLALVKTLAKVKAADIAADVERQFKALREGPKPLSAKQVSALSGIVYRALAEGLEDNPGLTSQQWLGVADANKAAQRGEYSLGARLGI
jgi:hypothetical protein